MTDSKYKLRDIDTIGYTKEEDFKSEGKKSYNLRSIDNIGYAKNIESTSEKRTYKLRDIDLVYQSKPLTAEDKGICECKHHRSSHYYGKTDNHAIGWHACFVIGCDCTEYKRR